jgi:hypothetical protein
MLALPGHTSEQRTLSKTQNNHLTGKAPYKVRIRFAPAESPLRTWRPREAARSAGRTGRNGVVARSSACGRSAAMGPAAAHAAGRRGGGGRPVAARN